MTVDTDAPLRRTRPRLALAATLSVQAMATLVLTAPSVMAPVVAPLLDVPPQRVGWFVGLAYLAAMFSGLVAGTRVARFGAIRMSRYALVACAVGLLIAAAGAGTLGALSVLALAALAIGAGYGLPNPSASMVLAVHAPPARRGLFFSIKQTGVPIGVGLAGLLVPVLLSVMAWPWALCTLAAMCVGLAIALRGATSLDVRLPAATDDRGVPGLAASLRAVVAPLAHVLGEPALRRLAVASLAYSTTQLCFVTFLVSYLKLEHQLGLAAAAGVLSVSQLVSVVCRVAWGHVADRWVSPSTLLAVLGLAMAAATATLGALPTDAPASFAMAAALACAATAMAWNGVFFAELSHRVPPAELGTVTGGTQFLTFCGGMTGPIGFASLVGVTGSHGATYVWMALAPAAVGTWLAFAARADARAAFRAG